jgi:hypothetical protein
VGIETARASILARERGREHVVDLFDMLVERVCRQFAFATWLPIVGSGLSSK